MSEMGIRLLYRIMNVRMSVSGVSVSEGQMTFAVVRTLDEFLGWKLT